MKTQHVLRIKGLPSNQKPKLKPVHIAQDYPPMQPPLKKDQSEGGKGVQNLKQMKQSSMADEYKQRQKRMDERLHKEIELNQIGQNPNKNYHSENQPPLSLQSTDQYMKDFQKSKEPQQFYRSQRSLAMRIKDNYDNQLNVLENDKLTLIQKLNDALVQLDKLNQERGVLSNKLIEQIKFVRDMQRETQKGDDLEGVVNQTMREDLRKEKELNVKLREELKRVEAERIRILEKIKELHHLSEQSKHQQEDIQIDMSQKSQTFDQTDAEFIDSQLLIQNRVNEIDRLRADDEQNAHDIKGLREQIQIVYSEKVEYLDNVRNIQDRYDNAIIQLSRERMDMDQMQCRHLKLMSCKVLCESLEVVLHQNMKATLSHLIDVTSKEKRLRHGLLTMRKVLHYNKKRILYKYLQKWYSNKLNPMKNMNQKKRVSFILQKMNPLMNYFQRWHLLYIWKQQQKRIMHQKLQSMFNAQKNYNKRVEKYSFLLWRDFALHMKQDGKEAVLVKLINKRLNYQKQAFAKWRLESQDIVQQIRLNAMAQRFTMKKYLSILFFSWRSVTQSAKVKRISLLVRTWKNLKTNAMYNKQLKAQTLAILREEQVRKDGYLKAMFDGFRQNKESEKLIKAQKQLYEVEIPLTNHVKEAIEKHQIVDEEKNKVKGLKVIIKFQSKIFYQYFQRWINNCEVKEKIINQNLKFIIIRRYNALTRQAFTSMIAFKGSAMSQQQEVVIQMQEEDNKELTNTIVQVQSEVDEKKQRQQCQSGKQMKKIMSGAFARMMQTRFNQWRQRVHQKIDKEYIVSKCMLKYDRRVKRLAIKLLQDKLKELKQNDFNEKRVKDIQIRLNQKEKRRIFEAIKVFSSNHQRAKNNLKRLFGRLSMVSKKSSFKLWSLYQKVQIESGYVEKQNNIVDEIKEIRDEEGELADILEQKKQQTNKMSNQLRSLCQKVIQRNFVRCHQQSQKYYFHQWKTQVDYQISKEALLRNVLTHFQRLCQHYSLTHWRAIASQEKQQTLFELCESQEQQIESTCSQMKYADKSHKDECQQKSDDFNKQVELQKIYNKQHENCVNALFNRINNNYSVSNKRNIVQQWRAYVQTRKRCLMTMDKVIKKTLWSEGFRMIKNSSKDVQQKDNFDYKLTKFITKYHKRITKLALSKWREGSFKVVTDNTEQLDKIITDLVDERNELIKRVDDRIVEQKLEHRRFLSFFDVFIAWKEHAKAKRLLRMKDQAFQESTRFNQIYNAIHKWQSRNAATKRVRRAAYNVIEMRKRLTHQKVIFAWKEYFQKQKNFLIRLNSLECFLDNTYLRESFLKIKQQAELNGKQTQSKQETATKLSFRFANYFNKRRKLEAFMKMKFVTLDDYQATVKQRATICHFLTMRVRSYFNQWKNEASMREVERFHNEEGQIRVDIHEIRKELLSLKQLARDDGHPEEEIKQILDDGMKKDIGLIEKGVCRFLCYNDDLYLLPWSFDAWRQWVQHKKLFRNALTYLNKRAATNTFSLANAFDKWKYNKSERTKQLEGQQKKDLEALCLKQEDELERCAQDIEVSEFTLDDLTDQRNLLLKSYVGSQKLALACSNANYERAKFKAFSRLLGATYDENQGGFEDALKANLEMIINLKAKIKHLEIDNDNLADQNEELRQGALDGIEMAKSVDDLTRERERLSVDLADKAICIRKLLEDNNNLSIRLSHAQEEAQNLIRVSQIKLQNGGGSEDLRMYY